MCYGAKAGEKYEVFFEAHFEASFEKQAQDFGDQLAKLYSNNGMPVRTGAVYFHNVYLAH